MEWRNNETDKPRNDIRVTHGGQGSFILYTHPFLCAVSQSDQEFGWSGELKEHLESSAAHCDDRIFLKPQNLFNYLLVSRIA